MWSRSPSYFLGGQAFFSVSAVLSRFAPKWAKYLAVSFAMSSVDSAESVFLSGGLFQSAILLNSLIVDEPLFCGKDRAQNLRDMHPPLC